MTRDTDVERLESRAADATRILRAAIAAADPYRAVSSALRDFAELRRALRVHLLAVGKAAGAMAAAALDTLPRAPASALIVVPHADRSWTGRATESLRVLHAAHPLPDASSVDAARQIERQLARATAGDVVLVLISGGASALCAAPVDGIGIDDYRAAVAALMRAGADIHELNAVRTHLDRLKGGGMARIAAPARAIGLIISDVPGNPLDIIASGPLTPSRTMPADALDILDRYQLLPEVPAGVRRALSSGPGVVHDFAHVTTRIVLDNRAAVEGAADEARRLGYRPHIREEPVTGSARDAGARLAAAAMAHADHMHHAAEPACRLYGGETTVVVTGPGRGGRNQELALSAALVLDGNTSITIGSVGTDGIDGPTDAAGAVTDGTTVLRGTRAGVNARDALHENDSYAFLEAAGALIHTGATGTNVMDVQVVLIDPPRSNRTT